jgi:hypothetical protein
MLSAQRYKRSAHAPQDKARTNTDRTARNSVGEKEGPLDRPLRAFSSRAILATAVDNPFLWVGDE